MKSGFFTFIFLICFVGVFAQEHFVPVREYRGVGATAITYKLDSCVVKFTHGECYARLCPPMSFTSFALAWKSDGDTLPAINFKLRYRVHSQKQRCWTKWKADEGYIMPSETRLHCYQSDLLFGVDEYRHDSVEFYIHSVDGARIADVHLILQDINVGGLPSDSVPKPADTGMLQPKSDDCPAFPDYIARSSWCGSNAECLSPTYTVRYRSPTHTVIHHGASPDTYENGAAVVFSYWNYHVNTNGWDDIGYNYLFDKSGNMYQGRHNPQLPLRDVHGAHVGNANTYSIGLNFLGNSDVTLPTDVQLDKCEQFLAWWYDYRQFDPQSTAQIINQANTMTLTLPRICGHRDVNINEQGQMLTTCPGDALYAELPGMRVAVANKIRDCSTFIIHASAGPNGNITPNDDVEVRFGQDAAFTITPDPNYHTISVLVDDEEVISQLVDGVYTFHDVDLNHTIRAEFAINKFIIAAGAGDNGSIEPDGDVEVTAGSDVDFTITPDANYHTISVLVDDEEAVSQLVDGVYTFHDVTDNHSIVATFVADSVAAYTIHAEAGAGGNISPHGNRRVPAHSDIDFTITPDANYHTISVLVDDEEAISQLVDGVYTFRDVDTNHTIRAEFAINKFIIAANAGNNGSIAPEGDVEVTAGSNKSFVVTPDAGYHVSHLLVDEVEAVSELVDGVYTFRNISSDHSIVAAFMSDNHNRYVIHAAAGVGGNISPHGNVGVSSGNDTTFVITPDANYHIISVLVDNEEAINELNDNQYTFYRVNKDHYIKALFAPATLAEQPLTNDVAIFPNPNDGHFHIFTGGEYVNPTVSIVNLQGREVFCQHFATSDPEIATQLAAGLYIIKIQDNQKINRSTFVVK